MKKFLLIVPMALGLAACQTSTDRTIATGALTGAAVGAIASDGDDRTKNAILGAGAGAAVGGLVSAASEPRQCTYRYADGSTRIAPCP